MSNNISSPRHEDGLIPTVQHSGLEVYTDKKPVYVHSSQELSYPSGQEHDRAPSQEPLQAQYIAPQEPRRRSWLIPAFIAALVTALITGGAIGGGLGSSLSNCKNDLEAAKIGTPTNVSGATSSSAAPAAATTTTGVLFADYVPQPSNKVSTLRDDCAELVDTTQTTLGGDRFNLICAFDLGSGQTAAETDAAGNPAVIADIVGMTMYTIADCLQACSQYSNFAVQWNRTERCRAVSFNTHMAQSIARDGANCWLKNGTLPASGSGTSNAWVTSAMLA